jgi:hypothetical protein
MAQVKLERKLRLLVCDDCGLILATLLDLDPSVGHLFANFLKCPYCGSANLCYVWLGDVCDRCYQMAYQSPGAEEYHRKFAESIAKDPEKFRKFCESFPAVAVPEGLGLKKLPIRRFYGRAFWG